MSIYTQPAEWTDALSRLPLGMSVADLMLLPAQGYSVLVIELSPPTGESVPVSSLPAGLVTHWIVAKLASASGMRASVSPGSDAQKGDQVELDNIPHLLRELSELPIEALASLAHVSRNAYYKWLAGKGVNAEHAQRLQDLLNAFLTLRDLKKFPFRPFLETMGPSGRPLDLLVAGQYDVVIGLALRGPRNSIEERPVSEAARKASGLSGWARPVSRLRWGAPRLRDVEREEALDRLSPRPLPVDTESFERLDESDDAFVAWGVVWE
jgi:transcriptional regulator with XRE-family HTH domain